MKARAKHAQDAEKRLPEHGARLFEAADVGLLTGKGGRMAVAVLDEGMAARVAELFDREDG